MSVIKFDEGNQKVKINFDMSMIKYFNTFNAMWRFEINKIGGSALHFV